MILQNFKKYNKIIVRLKAIKYKKNSFYYLFFYLTNLNLQAIYFLILFFKSYTFKTFYF